MKKIGLMGGTFNPIHSAHVAMAEAAAEEFHLDEVWFMPSGNPPHKDRGGMVSPEHRKRMVKLAIDGIKDFVFSDIEFRRDGVIYTSDTLEQIHGEHPKAELYFIMGGDSLIDFEKWHKPKKILKLCRILVVPRGDMPPDEMKRLCRERGKAFHGEIRPIHMEHIDISSSLIRDRIKSGDYSVLDHCPEKVAAYIRLHGLYGCPALKLSGDADEEEYIRCLEATLRPKRLAHTMGVAGTARELAEANGVDGSRARTAGLLHDCAKYFTGEEMISLCDENGIGLSSVERQNTALIHGKLGAFLARERYGVEDGEILSSIRYHTTGKPDMSTLEKIIYVADYIEPGRKMDCQPYPLSLVREICGRDLDEGFRMILANTVNHLRSSGMETDELTLQTYEYYKKEMSR